MELQNGDSFELLPAKGHLPAIILSVTASESNHRDYKVWKRRILKRHEQPFSLESLFASAYVATLRFQRVLLAWRGSPELAFRILCRPLQRILIWALGLSFLLQPTKPIEPSDKKETDKPCSPRCTRA